MGMHNCPIDKLARHIQEKIEQKTSKSSDCFRQAYKIFHKSSNITKSEFKLRLRTLGFCLNEAECNELFQRYDTDGSGGIDLKEFCQSILQRDYADSNILTTKGDVNRVKKLTENKGDTIKKVNYKRTDADKVGKIENIRQVEETPNSIQELNTNEVAERSYVRPRSAPSRVIISKSNSRRPSNIYIDNVSLQNYIPRVNARSAKYKQSNTIQNIKRRLYISSQGI